MTVIDGVLFLGHVQVMNRRETRFNRLAWSWADTTLQTLWWKTRG